MRDSGSVTIGNIPAVIPCCSRHPNGRTVNSAAAKRPMPATLKPQRGQTPTSCKPVTYQVSSPGVKQTSTLFTNLLGPYMHPPSRNRKAEIPKPPQPLSGLLGLMRVPLSDPEHFFKIMLIKSLILDPKNCACVLKGPMLAQPLHDKISGPCPWILYGQG